MRYISLDTWEPGEDWLLRASKVQAELDAASDRVSRSNIVEKNRALWGELREDLLKLSHQKCWFSEAKDCFSHWDVEHFRPKKSVKNDSSSNDEGYWWLAFDWHNYRICGNVGNRKKGAYFPLRAGSGRAGRSGDLRYEDPLLLDPSDPRDPTLLSFNIEGDAVCRPGLSDPWDIERVEGSIVRFGLDFPALVAKRRAIWGECWHWIETYRRELHICNLDRTNSIAREGSKAAARMLHKMIDPKRELSAVARACIASTGDPAVTNFL